MVNATAVVPCSRLLRNSMSKRYGSLEGAAAGTPPDGTPILTPWVGTEPPTRRIWIVPAIRS